MGGEIPPKPQNSPRKKTSKSLDEQNRSPACCCFFNGLNFSTYHISEKRKRDVTFLKISSRAPLHPVATPPAKGRNRSKLYYEKFRSPYQKLRSLGQEIRSPPRIKLLIPPPPPSPSLKPPPKTDVPLLPTVVYVLWPSIGRCRTRTVSMHVPTVSDQSIALLITVYAQSSTQ